MCAWYLDSLGMVYISKDSRRHCKSAVNNMVCMFNLWANMRAGGVSVSRPCFFPLSSAIYCVGFVSIQRSRRVCPGQLKPRILQWFWHRVRIITMPFQVSSPPEYLPYIFCSNIRCFGKWTLNYFVRVVPCRANFKYFDTLISEPIPQIGVYYEFQEPVAVFQ